MGNEKQVAYTSIVNKYPSYRRDQVNGCWKWLRGRRADDNAEGLWRVHDKLYDLKDFVSNHPGGSDWLTLTKGTDITEAFESYHIRSIAEQLLPKYFIRDASAARNYRLTFEEDGFYRTLKRRAAEKYKTLDKSSLWQSKLILDLNVLALFMSSIAVMYLDGFGMKFFAALIASICAGWMNTLSHNFTHQRDNWRMYTSNLILIGWDDWRTYHGLSHHLYPNSYTDYEVSSYEHVLPWIPIVFKSKLTTLNAYVMTPFAYAFLYHIVWIQRWTGYFMEKRQKFAWQEFIPLTLPLAMFLLGNSNVSIRNLVEIILVWQGVIISGSFLYSVVAVNAGHHGPKMIHEGDEFKSLDYGIYQLGATIDRSETKANLFMTLTHFGDHLLHHLFPSLDHVLLPQFRDVLFKTCEDFNQKAPTDCTLLQAVVDQFKQLSRTTTIKLQ